MGWLQKPVWLLTASVALLLLLGFGLLFYSSWRHDRELEPVQRHLDYIAAMQTVDDRLRALAVEYVVASPQSLAAARVEALQRDLAGLEQSGNNLDPASSAQIAAIRQELMPFSDGDGTVSAQRLDTLMGAMQDMRRALMMELAAHKSLIAEKRQLARREEYIALGLLIGLFMVAFPLGVLIRRRIALPIDTIAFLMSLMSKQEYASAYVSRFDPMLRPLFINYNHLVNRLVSLEQQHQKREESLSESVRRATRILIQQQGRVAQAERLGAIGEIAASVAHELRNPLTAVYMSLQNLRHDLTAPDHVSRVELMISETKRINHQINSLLDSARQNPEVLTPVNVTVVLRELCTLVRYQISEQIRIEIDAPEELICQLPEMQFHQCVLNLLINAGQLLADQPGYIRVEAGLTGRELRLVVEDSGPGFPPQMLETSVRPFSSWRSGGTGLGLVMVRRFTSDLGGQLQLENREPQGARITMKLPCRNLDAGREDNG
jgi:signal transduction histidine kinase